MATSRNFGEFAQRMVILADTVKGNSEKTVRRAALAADQTIVTLTPVDLGRAKANWIVTVGKPNTGTVESPGAGAAESQALAQGRGVIAGYKLGAGGIFITNNLPYIKRLNDGYSRKRPEGMLDGAIQAALQQFRKARLFNGF